MIKIIAISRRSRRLGGCGTSSGAVFDKPLEPAPWRAGTRDFDESGKVHRAGPGGVAGGLDPVWHGAGEGTRSQFVRVPRIRLFPVKQIFEVALEGLFFGAPSGDAPGHAARSTARSG